jgi:Protein of unknown function (DUF3306)
MAPDEASGFLSRWARRKEQVRSGRGAVAEAAARPADAPAAPPTVASTAAPTAASPVVAVPAGQSPVSAEPVPTLEDVALLTRESDYSRFVAAGVDEGVKRAAMKKLFADPRFNVMDGLDTYIDDYGKPDPIPLAMLRKMNQSKVLRLFDAEEDDPRNAETTADRHTAQPTDTLEAPSPPDDDPDLQLQQDDAAGRTGADQGAGA